MKPVVLSERPVVQLVAPIEKLVERLVALIEPLVERPVVPPGSRFGKFGHNHFVEHEAPGLVLCVRFAL